MQVEFVHAFGEGKIMPIPNGKGVLIVAASIPLGRLELGYSQGRVERLAADARQFASDNQLDDFVMTQGRIGVQSS
jgi:hypothetical protein